MTLEFEQLFNQNLPRILRIARRYANGAEVEDLVQEISMALWRSHKNFRGESSIETWLYRIAIRQTINYRRRTGRQDRLLTQFAGAKTRPDSSAANPYDWVLAEEQQLSVAAALECLSAQAREILLLKYAEGWTYKQLASHLGVKVKTVEHRLMKARRELRCRLREQGIEEK